MILSNGKLENYRLTLASARLDQLGRLLISAETAAALKLNAGEPVRYVLAAKASAAKSKVTSQIAAVA